MDVKRLRHVEIKDADKGIVDLVFATFNVIDSDNDVTLPGAFEDGAHVPISSYGHGSTLDGRLPVGAGTLGPHTSKEARATAQFFMDTPHGLDTFKTVKRLHEKGLGDWSYAYEPKEYSFGEFDGQHVRFLAKQRVKELSPVLEGAGINTRTRGAKNRGPDGDEPPGQTWHGAIPPHQTDTTTKAWSPVDAAEDLTFDATMADLRSMHAWLDPTANPDRKASWRFMHHDGVDGPASIRACLMGIAVLNGAKGPPIPDDARSHVYNHLAGHLRDADRVPPQLREPGKSLGWLDEAMVVLADFGELRHLVETGAVRGLKDRGLTKAKAEVFGWIQEEMDYLRSTLEKPDETAAREYARFIKLSRGM